MRTTTLRSVTNAAPGARKRRAYAARVPPEVRRRQLLDAALRLISREGYDRVTVEAVAAEAGVTKPVVYSTYPKLAVLLGELLDETQAQAVSQLLGAFPAEPRGGAGAVHLAADVTRAWARAVRENPDTWVPILLAGPGTPKVVLDRIEQSRVLVRDAIASMLAQGVGGPATARHHLLAEALVAVAEHFGRRLVTEPEAVDDDELAGLVDDLVRGGLARD